MPQKAKSLFDFKSIIDQIKFLNFDFRVKEERGKFYLQAEFEAQDTITRKIETQHSRKWQLSPYMTDSEVVQTVFKCVLTAIEHETRESFTYQGCRIFSPHFDVNAPAEIFNGVIIQDNGIDYFDVYGDINTCKLCGLYPEVALLPPNEKGSAFGFFCTHQETSEEGSDYLIVDNQNLEIARLDWNKLNGLEAQCQS